MRLRETLRQSYKWWKTWGTFPVLEWVHGAALFRSGEYRLAEKFYRKGLKKHPNHLAQSCARLDLAYCLFRQAKLVEAEQELRHVATHSPELREAHVRLARLQLWQGHPLDAAWSIRRALRSVAVDEDLATLFLTAVIENEGPWYLFEESQDACHQVLERMGRSVAIESALAYLRFQRGELDDGLRTLEGLSQSSDASGETFLLLGRALLEKGDIERSRETLRSALSALSDNPRVLTMLAKSYLISGTTYNADYARQLATEACQRSEWLSPAAMHTLAEAFYHSGDRASALIIASKAKEEGNRLLGSYREVRQLDQLIESLATGSLA